MQAAARNWAKLDRKCDHPAFLWWVFQQWWKVGIPVGLTLAAIVAASVMYMHVPKYDANSLLMIEDFSPVVAFSNVASSGQSQRYIQTQLEILRSPVVLEPASSRPEIASIEGTKRECGSGREIA